MLQRKADPYGHRILSGACSVSLSFDLFAVVLVVVLLFILKHAATAMTLLRVIDLNREILPGTIRAAETTPDRTAVGIR